MTSDELYEELKEIKWSPANKEQEESRLHRISTVICNDCMNGHHEVIGHDNCECSCHGNPVCFYCGKPSKVDHPECVDFFDEMRLDNPSEHSDYRYEWER